MNIQIRVDTDTSRYKTYPHLQLYTIYIVDADRNV